MTEIIFLVSKNADSCKKHQTHWEPGVGRLYVALELSKALSVKIYLLRTERIKARIWRKNLPVPMKVDVVSVAVASAGTDHLREPV